MPEPVKVNVVSYGGVKPGELIAGNGADGTRTVLFSVTDTNGDSMFYKNKGLTSWNVALPNLTKGDSMFHSCENLAEFNADMPHLTIGSAMFYMCRKLTSWNSDLRSLTNGQTMFAACTGLTSWNSDLRSLTNGQTMFLSCTGLTSWNSDLRSLTNGADMFSGCKLDLQSVQNIANTINSSLESGSITIGVDKTKITQEQQDELDAVFASKNWTVAWQRN